MGVPERVPREARQLGLGRLNPPQGMPCRRSSTVKKVLSIVTLLCLCLWVVLSGCGGTDRESLTDCEEAETGYVLNVEKSGLDCGQASIILGLIGSALSSTFAGKASAISPCMPQAEA